MSTEHKIKNMIKKHYHVDVVGSKTTFKEDLGADSLSILELIMDLEDEFDITIPENDLRDGSMNTVGDLINYISGRLNNGSQSLASIRS